MDTQVTQFKSLWAESTAIKPTDEAKCLQLRDQAKTIAKSWAQANEARMSNLYSHLTEDQMVSQITFLKKQERFEEADELKMWIMANFAPKQITGSMGPRPKIIRAQRDGR